MLWKAYFVVYALLTVVGLFGLLQYSSLNVIDVLGVFLSVVLVVGLYAYVFKKKLLNPRQWQLVLWVVILFLIEELVVLYIIPPDVLNTSLSFLKGSIPISPADSLFSWAISVPALSAIYRLSLKKK